MSSQRREPPTTVEEFIRRVVLAADLPADDAARVRSDLHAHFEDGLAEGVAPEELMRRFGNPESAGRRVAAERRTVRRGSAASRMSVSQPSAEAAPWWTVAGQELGLALRSLRRSPRFAALVLVTLALGVGANTAVFSVLDAVLLRPLPYDEPERLVRVTEMENDVDYGYVRAPSVRAMQGWDDVFEGVATVQTYREMGRDLTGGERAERLIVSPVSAGFFELLGARPLLGRSFREDESTGPGEYGPDGRPNIAMLSHDLWQRRFAGDRSVLGQMLELDGAQVEVVGVMEPGFVHPIGSEPDLWIPQDLRLGGSNSWGNYYLTVIGRLPVGLTLDVARERATRQALRVQEEQPESRNWSTVLEPLQSDLVGRARQTMLWVLAGAVLLVLLSACVNVANLVFARGLQRERELALRGALGSTRTRLSLHMLCENVWLALGGVTLGLAVGVPGVRLLLHFAPQALPQRTTLLFDGEIFAFALAAMLVTLLVFGVGPAWVLSRVAPARALRGSGRASTDTPGLRRLRSALVIAQSSVALVLLLAAGLLLQSFLGVRSAALGVDPSQTFTYEVHLPWARYPDGAARQQLHERLQERVASLPGVVATGATSRLPLEGRYHTWGSPIRVVDVTAEDLEIARRGASSDVRVIEGDLFEALGIVVQQGPRRADLHAESESSLWLSRSAVDSLFEAGEEPVGELIWHNGELRRIVGVVGDVAYDGRGATSPMVYYPHVQMAEDRNWPLTQVVRTVGDPFQLQELIEAELRMLDADLVLFRPQVLDSLLARARAQDRFALQLMSLFAALAAALVAIGTYGVLAGDVTRRRREFGIRMALGAERYQVRRRVLRQAARMAGAGIVFGSLIAWAASRWIASLLHEVRANDLATFIAAALFVLGTGLIASLVPAQRATRVDPASCLTE